ncbi:hypothetical protein PRUPE_4G268200 [Prunus persica]|uniref:F-box domain-containing protein n=1 Tax=Prunus persica TaxID=3760 RepID=A0A251PRK3_PRUPE|nr:hypothetical protein PRUPE_4G268200 [Prunus persica]
MPDYGASYHRNSSSVFSLRLTCKHFKRLVFSPSLISKDSSSSPFSSFLLLSHPQCYNHFALYDSALILSLQFLSCLQSFDQVLKNDRIPCLPFCF